MPRHVVDLCVISTGIDSSYYRVQSHAQVLILKIDPSECCDSMSLIPAHCAYFFHEVGLSKLQFAIYEILNRFKKTEAFGSTRGELHFSNKVHSIRLMPMSRIEARWPGGHNCQCRANEILE